MIISSESFPKDKNVLNGTSCCPNGFLLWRRDSHGRAALAPLLSYCDRPEKANWKGGAGNCALHDETNCLTRRSHRETSTTTIQELEHVFGCFFDTWIRRLSLAVKQPELIDVTGCGCCHGLPRADESKHTVGDYRVDRVNRRRRSLRWRGRRNNRPIIVSRDDDTGTAEMVNLASYYSTPSSERVSCPSHFLAAGWLFGVEHCRRRRSADNGDGSRFRRVCLACCVNNGNDVVCEGCGH